MRYVTSLLRPPLNSDQHQKPVNCQRLKENQRVLYCNENSLLPTTIAVGHVWYLSHRNGCINRCGKWLWPTFFYSEVESGIAIAVAPMRFEHWRSSSPIFHCGKVEILSETFSIAIFPFPFKGVQNFFPTLQNRVYCFPCYCDRNSATARSRVVPVWSRAEEGDAS